MTSALQIRMERRMVDRCTITRDTQGADDDVLDQTTGVLTPPSPDTSTVYTGRCLVYARPRTDQQPTIQGGAAVTVQDYVAAIPLAESGPRGGDNLVVTKTNDPWLLNRSFRLIEVVGGTYAVTRDFKLEEWS